MDDKTKQMLEYFGLYDEVVKHGEHVTVSKAVVMPNDGKVKAFVRIILAVSDDPQVKGTIS
jgi:hypothetical protein